MVRKRSKPSSEKGNRETQVDAQNEEMIIDNDKNDKSNLKETEITFDVEQQRSKSQQPEVRDDEPTEEREGSVIDQIIIPEPTNENKTVPELGGQDTNDRKKGEDLRNLLRNPDEQEIKDGIEQEEFNEVAWSQVENDPVEQAFDQNIDLSGLELDKIISYSFEEGRLFFLVRFNSGKECPIPYLALKEDFPLETVEYIMIEVDKQDRYGRYAQWARKILREQRRRKVGLLKISEENKARRAMLQK